MECSVTIKKGEMAHAVSKNQTKPNHILFLSIFIANIKWLLIGIFIQSWKNKHKALKMIISGEWDHEGLFLSK